MGVILKPTFFKTEEQLLKEYVQLKSSELETDAQNRRSGLKNSVGGYKRAGYDILRQFFDGDQWNYVPEEGGNLRVYNFVAATVFNYAAFMTNEIPEFDVPVDEITDPIEVDRAERKEILLKEVLKDNSFPLQYESGVLSGSLLGDTFFVGPFWNQQQKKIYFSLVRKPENIKPIFSSDDFQTIIGFIWDYWMAKETAEEMFGDKLKERGVNLTEQTISDNGVSASEQTSQKMVKVQQYWDDTYMELLVGNQVADYVKHEWGFVPLIHIANLLHPTSWNGVSDAENILDAQVEYNEKNANVSDILASDAYPTIFGKNLEPVSLKASKIALIDLGDDAELIPDPRQGKTAPIQDVLQNRQKDIFNLAGLNELFYGGSGVQEASGRALSVLMQPINNRIRGKQIRWRAALQELCINIFKLMEIYVPKSKEIINGTYDVDIFFPGTLLRNVTDELNKYARKVQSRYTTMKNIGVPSPKDEEALISKEAIADGKLQAELAQIVASAQMDMQQKQQGGSGPMLNEFENQGEQPAAVKGVSEQSPISPKGNLEQQNQRKTGVPTIKSKKK